MKRNDKQRLFEVMGRLDKTFKPRLNEGFEEELPTKTGPEVGTDSPIEEPKEKTPEEKLQELTAKVDEMYAMLHGEEEEDVPAEETGETGPEGLTEWNFDKKKGEKKDEKEEDKEKSGKKKWNFEKKEDKESKEHEESETPAEEKREHKEKKELDETKPNNGKKIPVAPIAKVGK
jgi:hypothetical protein